MPVFRPTPRCIWNSFRSSDARRLHLKGCSAEELQAIRALAAQDKLNAVEILLGGEDCADAFHVDLASPYGSAGCVIMASGLGRRFGGNKLMAPFSGAPLIRRALNATEGIFERRAVVTRHADVADYCRERSIEVVLHDLPLRSDAVRLGIEALGDADSCLFCPGDQPLLKRETVAALVLLHRNAPDFIHRVSCSDVPGSPVLFPAWAFEELCNLPDGRGGGALIQKYPGRLRSLNVENPLELMDADTPADLEYLLQHLPKREVTP